MSTFNISLSYSHAAYFFQNETNNILKMVESELLPVNAAGNRPITSISSKS